MGAGAVLGPPARFDDEDGACAGDEPPLEGELMGARQAQQNQNGPRHSVIQVTTSSGARAPDASASCTCAHVVIQKKKHSGSGATHQKHSQRLNCRYLTGFLGAIALLALCTGSQWRVERMRSLQSKAEAAHAKV